MRLPRLLGHKKILFLSGAYVSLSLFLSLSFSLFLLTLGNTATKPLLGGDACPMEESGALVFPPIVIPKVSADGQPQSLDM